MQHLRKDANIEGRCISQSELAKRWQISEATLERRRSQRKGPQFLRLGGQLRYRLVVVESYERERLEVFGTGQNNSKALISPVRTGKKSSRKSTAYPLKVRAVEGS